MELITISAAGAQARLRFLFLIKFLGSQGVAGPEFVVMRDLHTYTECGLYKEQGRERGLEVDSLGS